MTNISSLRDSADTLLDQGKFEAAFDIYDVVHNQVWFAIGNIQSGLNQFSNNFLNHNFSASVEFKKNYTKHAADSVFIKSFELDSDETLNEFIFAVYGRLQSICFSKTLADKISLNNVLSEFLILYNMILYGAAADWVLNILRITTPFVESNRLKKIRPNFSHDTLKEMLVEESRKIKETDWFALNISLLDYLKITDEKHSDLFKEISRIIGPYTSKSKNRYRKGKNNTHKDENANYNYYEKYERYEKYEKYEKFEKQFYNSNDTFDFGKATEFEKTKYFGDLFDLKGQVTITEIRKRYLELILKYHPDKVADMGQELIQVAEKKTKEINQAFEWFRKKYSI